MKLEPTTDKRVEEIAQIYAKHSSLGLGIEWIALKYEVTRNIAISLQRAAMAELRNYPHKYYFFDFAWENEVIVPDAHRFIPRNLYREIEPETFIITKQSKLNYD